MERNTTLTGILISLLSFTILSCTNPALKKVDIYLKQGNYVRAVDILEHERKKHPKDGELLTLLAEYHGVLGNYREMKNILDDQTLESYQYRKRADFIREKYWRMNFNQAIDRLSRDRVKEAADFLNNAIIVDDEKAATYAILGDAYLKLEEVNKAINAYTRHINLDKKSTISCENLSELYFQKRQFLQSIHLAQEAIQRDPNLFSSYLRMAFAYQEIDSMEAAENAYQNAQDLNQTVLLLEEFGKFCYRRKKYEMAKEKFSQGLLLSQNADRFYKYLAECSFGLNDFQNVAAYYEKYITNHKDDREALKNLLVAYNRLGDKTNYIRIHLLLNKQ